MNDQTPVPVKNRNLPAADGPFGWLRTEIDRLFDDFTPATRSIFNFGAQLAPLPALEFVEKDQEYRLTAELPGLDEKDIDISVAEGVLTISGEKREESDRKQDGMTVSERRYGSFSRSVRLPRDVDADKISAGFDKGVLTVTMAKNAATAPAKRKIEIGK